MIEEYRMQIDTLTEGQINELVGKTDFAAVQTLIAASNSGTSANAATMSAAIAATVPAKHLSAKSVDTVTS
jgi:hypothetical protein